MEFDDAPTGAGAPPEVPESTEPTGDAAPPPREAPGPDLAGTLIDDETIGPDNAERGAPIGRRAFMGIVGFGLSSLVWGNAALDLLNKSTRLLPQSVRGVVPFGEGWRIYAVNPPFPKFDPATWTMSIEGMVSNPMTLNYEQLRALPAAEQVTDFHCVTGWSVPKVPWKGVRVKDLIGPAKPWVGATGLEIWSAEEDYVDTLTMEQALESDVMLAYEMGGKPITREHGAPTRFVIPKMYGYKGVKWVSKIVVTSTLKPGYWELRGYDVDAYIGHSNGF